MTAIDLSWFAGVLDVSGKIYMRTDPSGYEHPILELRAKEEVVKRFAEAFGGKINTYQSDGKRLPYWRLVCSKATVVLAQVRPFMRIRGERVDVLLAWKPKTGPWKEDRKPRGFDQQQLERGGFGNVELSSQGLEVKERLEEQLEKHYQEKTAKPSAFCAEDIKLFPLNRWRWVSHGDAYDAVERGEVWEK